VAGRSRTYSGAIAELVRFLAVGTAGFIADAGALSVLVYVYEIPPLIARLFSFPPAVALTWLLNRYWTFASGRDRPAGNQLALYFAVQISGLFVNYGLFATLVANFEYWYERPLLALAAGSLVALNLTFLLSRLFAFSTPGR
jgi:putative flippase GtrA